jgi:hypothetical protein
MTPSSPSDSDLAKLQRLERLTKNLTNLARNGNLITTTPITSEAIQLLVMASEDLSGAQHDRGIMTIQRTSQYWPNGAQLRAACLGVPVESLATMAASDDALEVNRLYGWMTHWLQWLVKGHRFKLTIGAYGEHPVSYEFVSGSLTEGLETVADRKLRPLRLELRIAEARLEAYEQHHYPGPAAEKISSSDKEIDYWRKAFETGYPAGAWFDKALIDVEAQRVILLPWAAEDQKRVRTKCKQYQDAVATAKANVEAAENERLFCRLTATMAPKIPPVLSEVLVLLDLTVEAAIQRFANKDRFIKMEFRKRAMEVVAGHAKDDPYTPASRQIAGAVMSDNEPWVSEGVISIDPNGDVRYYSVEVLREEQAAGLPIDDKDIEDQEVFIENIDEISNARYVPPPPPPQVFTVLTSTSQEDDYEGALVLSAAREVEEEAQQDRTAAEETRRKSLWKQHEEMKAQYKK